MKDIFYLILHPISFTRLVLFCLCIEVDELECLRWAWECGSTTPSLCSTLQNFTSVFLQATPLAKFLRFVKMACWDHICTVTLTWTTTASSSKLCAQPIDTG